MKIFNKTGSAPEAAPAEMPENGKVNIPAGSGRLLWCGTEEAGLILSALLSVFMLQNLSGLPVKSSLSFLPLNLIVLYCFYKLIHLIAGRILISIPVGDLCLFVFGVGNYYVNQFRGVMILPWDILAVGTAADVVGTYHFTLYPEEFLWAGLILVKFLALFFAGKKQPAVKKGLFHGKGRLVYAVLSVIVCFVLLRGMMTTEKYRSIPDRLYLVERYYKTQGIPVSFFHYCKFLYTPKPEGYSVQACLDAVAEAEQESGAAAGDGAQTAEGSITPDNVIVIMNESFADFSALGTLPEIDESLSFWNSLSENTVRGNLYVPVYGGTTVNTEYEFLTGNSTAYMKGCPFSYAVREQRPSLAWYFAGQGYEVHGMHPARPENWNRKSVYPYLGLTPFISLNELEPLGPELINEHTTDAWDFDQVIRLYEEKKSDKFFLFNVTMQNHSGYDFDFEGQTDAPHTDLSAYGDMKKAENYLSLLNMSDEAFERLVEYFEKVDEPTMICMFGDHQPKLEDDFYTLLKGSPVNEDDPEDNIRLYTTPFVIWTNYDIPEQTIDRISANYLSEVLLETAGADLPGYYEFLDRLKEKYPVLGTNGVYDAEGNFYTADEVAGDDLVKQYRCLIYNSASEKKDKVQWDLFR